MVLYVITFYAVCTGISLFLYIPKLVQLCHAFKKPPYRIAKSKRKIALVVPARNESAIIGDLFDSVLKQDYDGAFFDVNVIVKDGKDNTVPLAQAIGANVFVVEEQDCKGAALDGYFRALTKEQFSSYDAFVIVDADAILDGSFVSELNNALEHDYQIFLSRKLIKNFLGSKKERTLFSNCSALTYPILDDLGNAYRTDKGIPLNMCGQGMMVRREVIEKIGGWPYRTLTEDYELRLDCILNDFTSMYYPYAVVYTEEVLKHKDSYARRLRWVTGYSQCDRMYKKRVKERVKKRGKMNAGEYEYFFSLYPVLLFLFATLAAVGWGIGLSVYYAASGSFEWIKSLPWLVLFPLAVTYTLLFLYNLLAMLAYWDAFGAITKRERLATLLFAPIYTLEYFPIFIQSRLCARSRPAWKQTARVEYSKKKSA